MTAWSIHIRFYSKQTRRLSQSRSHGFRAQKLDLWASLTNTVWAMNCKVSCNTNNSSAPRARCFSRCCCFRVFQWMVLRAFVHCFFLFLFFFFVRFCSRLSVFLLRIRQSVVNGSWLPRANIPKAHALWSAGQSLLSADVSAESWAWSI